LTRSLRLSAGLIAAIALLAVAPGGASAAKRHVKLQARYLGVSCPSGDRNAVLPLPDAKLVVKFGSRTIRTVLGPNGDTDLTLKGRGHRFKAKVVLDGDLVEVDPYGDNEPYSYTDSLKLTRKRTYTMKLDDLEHAGAASVWSILRQGAELAKRSMPTGVTLAKVAARYDPNRAVSAGNPDDEPGVSYYDANTDQIFVESRGRAEEFEPWVLLHEYGHHVLETVAEPGPDSGGSHEFTRSYPNRPAMPWSEGFATAFAAIARDNPVLGTLCRTGVNISRTPAIPRSTDDPWLNQYHEISVSGVLWGVAGYLGGGDRQAGMKRLLASLHAFHAKYGGPKSLREVRDALVVGGAESSQQDYRALFGAFADQRVNWGLDAHMHMTDSRTAGSQADYEVKFVLQRPEGKCELTSDSRSSYAVGGSGGIPYVSGLDSDDCMMTGGDGKIAPTSGSNVPLAGLQLGLPFLDREAHRKGSFALSAKWICKDDPIADDPNNPLPQWFRCTSSRGFEFDLVHGARREQTVKVQLQNGIAKSLVRFDAVGECTIVANGEDCSI
jgi:hypothetical protein